MNRLLFSLGMSLFAAATLLVPASARAVDPQVQEVTPDQVEKMLGAPDVRIYDVNDLDMFNKSHVPGAIHVGTKKLAGLLPSDKSTRLVFYCANTL